MEKEKMLERRVGRLEKRLDEAEARGRALEKVIERVIGEASRRAFEFAVQQYGWQELREKHEKAVEAALRKNS